MAVWTKRWSNSAARQRMRMMGNILTASALFLANFWKDPPVGESDPSQSNRDEKMKNIGLLQEVIGFTASFAFTAYDYVASRMDARDLFADYIREEKGLAPDAKVSFSDVSKSDNALLADATKLLNRNAVWGLLTDLPFIVPTLFRKAWQGRNADAEKTTSQEEPVFLKSGIGAIAGVGSKAAYGWYRYGADKPNSTDALLLLNRVMFDRESLEPVTSSQVFMAYQRFAGEHGIPTADGADGRAVEVFERIAKYLEYTRHHVRDHPDTPQQVKFSLPEFIYLLGTNKLDINNIERTEAWLEVLSHADIKTARDIEKAMAAGGGEKVLMDAAAQLHNDYEMKKEAHDRKLAAEGRGADKKAMLPADPGGCPGGKLGETCAAKKQAALEAMNAEAVPAVKRADQLPPHPNFKDRATQGAATPEVIAAQKAAAMHEAQQIS